MHYCEKVRRYCKCDAAYGEEVVYNNGAGEWRTREEAEEWSRRDGVPRAQRLPSSPIATTEARHADFTLYGEVGRLRANPNIYPMQWTITMIDGTQRVVETTAEPPPVTTESAPLRAPSVTNSFNPMTRSALDRFMARRREEIAAERERRRALDEGLARFTDGRWIPMNPFEGRPIAVDVEAPPPSPIDEDIDFGEEDD